MTAPLDTIRALFRKQTVAANLLANHLGEVVLGIHKLYHTSPDPGSCPHPICESTMKLLDDIQELEAIVPQD